MLFRSSSFWLLHANVLWQSAFSYYRVFSIRLNFMAEFWDVRICWTPNHLPNCMILQYMIHSKTFATSPSHIAHCNRFHLHEPQPAWVSNRIFLLHWSKCNIIDYSNCSFLISFRLCIRLMKVHNDILHEENNEQKLYSSKFKSELFKEKQET